MPAGITLRDHYTAQEDQAPDFAVPYTDFGARQYNTALRRWMTPDPLSEKYYGISPYAFCNNSPMVFVDPDGEAIDIIADIASIGFGIYNLTQNIIAGNSQAAWSDVAGIGIDLVCAILPGVTINAGIANTVAKSSVKTIDRFIDSKGAWNLKPFERGQSIEKTLGGWGNNFPVIDKFDKVTGTITSIKSIDLNAKSYQSGNALFNKVKGYIDKLANFNGRSNWGSNNVPNGEISTRVLELAIPEGATDSQLDQLIRLREYAVQQDIQMTITLMK